MEEQIIFIFHAVLAFILILLLVISLVGNSVVIVVMIRKKSQASVNCYIIAVASISLINSIFSIPFAFVEAV